MLLRWDHPRVCGEKLPVRRAAAGRAGSPPRMRGKVAAISAYNAAPGITPAYAGKSTLHRDDAPLSWDHPRVCGEKKRKGNSPHARTGSPPRMRGKVPAGFLEVVQPRITPAYAGKRLPSLLFLALHWDHPRVCGEKTLLFLKWCSDTGSPPRMRGKVSIASRFVCCFEDHPRVCGEKLNALLVAGSLMGSPPRMRGKVHRTRQAVWKDRITPAYAGKSAGRSSTLLW